MRKIGFAILLICLAGYVYWSSHPAPQVSESVPHRTQEPARKPKPPAAAANENLQATAVEEPTVVETREQKREKPVLPFKIKDGLMIVQGDVVVGQPSRPDTPTEGLVEIRAIQLWPHATIAYHIQPNVSNPERITEAMAMFANTAVHFVYHTNEEDVLVFEQGSENCLSYVGKMGGNQPLWISPSCAPADVAHEILHALGFVHEQNRTDRDDYIEVNFANIDERQAGNFEKLPPEFMKVTGLGPFDFQSLMIYPPWMFAKNGQSTMEAKSKDQLIQPGSRLSTTDIERVNRAYGP